MRLRWTDGRVLVVRLDHGLSFLRTQGYSAWRFATPRASSAGPANILEPRRSGGWDAGSGVREWAELEHRRTVS